MSVGFWPKKRSNQIALVIVWCVILGTVGANIFSSNSNEPTKLLTAPHTADRQTPQGDPYALGAHSARGAQYDMTRDGIYLMSRSAGNAARCGIIRNGQVQRIIDSAIATRLTGDTSEVAARAKRFASEGLHDPDCSTWSDPRAVQTERSVATTLAP